MPAARSSSSRSSASRSLCGKARRAAPESLAPTRTLLWHERVVDDEVLRPHAASQMTATLVAWPLTKTTHPRRRRRRRARARGRDGPAARRRRAGSPTPTCRSWSIAALAAAATDGCAVQAEIVVGGEIQDLAPVDPRRGAGAAVMHAKERVARPGSSRGNRTLLGAAACSRRASSKSAPRRCGRRLGARARRPRCSEPAHRAMSVVLVARCRAPCGCFDPSITLRPFRSLPSAAVASACAEPARHRPSRRAARRADVPIGTAPLGVRARAAGALAASRAPRRPSIDRARRRAPSSGSSRPKRSFDARCAARWPSASPCRFGERPLRSTDARRGTRRIAAISPTSGGGRAAPAPPAASRPSIIGGEVDRPSAVAAGVAGSRDARRRSASLSTAAGRAIACQSIGAIVTTGVGVPDRGEHGARAWSSASSRGHARCTPMRSASSRCRSGVAREIAGVGDRAPGDRERRQALRAARAARDLRDSRWRRRRRPGRDCRTASSPRSTARSSRARSPRVSRSRWRAPSTLGASTARCARRSRLAISASSSTMAQWTTPRSGGCAAHVDRAALRAASASATSQASTWTVDAARCARPRSRLRASASGMPRATRARASRAPCRRASRASPGRSRRGRR